MSDLIKFERSLRRVVDDSAGRPFLCDGSPFDCDVFIVGINPGTDTPFWPFWSSDHGFDKTGWLNAYLRQHRVFGKTRRNIERLCKAANPSKILETNVFHRFSKRLADLNKADRKTDAFDFLLNALRPRVVFVHGKPAREHLEQITGSSLRLGEFVRVRLEGHDFDVIAGHHLAYQWSNSDIDEIGRKLHFRSTQSPVAKVQV